MRPGNRGWSWRSVRWGICGLALWLASLGCTLTWDSASDEANPDPVSITASPVVSSDWTAVAPGIERREMTLPGGSLNPYALVFRLDPAQVVFRAHYSPGAPRDMAAWQAALPDAAVIVNGGFFDETDQALGLLVTDGQMHGQSFWGFGGMLQVSLDGAVRVRSLVSEPYQSEGLFQAVQSFPMLVEAGGIQASQGDGFEQRSRRTIIAQDSAGHILLAVIPYGLVSFSEVQAWLLSSDLDVQIAVALDGGRSTGLVVRTALMEEQYPAFSELPAVLAVYVR